MARIRRSHLNGPAICRRRSGRGFRYCWATGEALQDPATLERIRALAIPPAWTDVWICPWPNGHIQATGTDAAGRRQYRYHDEWRRLRDIEKFSHMVAFATALPALRVVLDRDLGQPGLSRSRVLALSVRLLEIGMFRIGGEEYAEAHETYGLATIEKRHVSIRNGSAIFDYAAKGGKQRILTITDPVLVDLLGQLKRRRIGGDALLAWRDGGEWVDARSDDLNAYLKEATGGPFTAKDFRTRDASLLAAILCAQLRPTTSPSARARRIAGVVREVAEALGNTPAVCRKAYIDPRIIDRFEHGETIGRALAKLPTPLDLADAGAICDLERAVIELLTDEGAVVLLAS